MEWNVVFFFNSVLLGVGLAMDTFCVSLSNGLSEPTMKAGKMCKIAGVFAFFQAMMPMIGWICVHTVLQYFQAFEKWIPWIAFGLLLFIGGKMLIEGIRQKSDEMERPKVGRAALLVQGVATSIDALSVGFTIAEYDLLPAVVCALMIATTTFVICVSGVKIGKKLGTRLANKATILGGVILIVIGLEILLA
ncbi:MAG: manganese efflux pump MntP family protein [Clostridiales bacterium]|nr:manganese efflux pump MntP family protein [Clostridiales bacterium]